MADKQTTAALRHELEHDQHEFEFVEAATQVPMAAGECHISPTHQGCSCVSIPF